MSFDEFGHAAFCAAHGLQYCPGRLLTVQPAGSGFRTKEETDVTRSEMATSSPSNCKQGREVAKLYPPNEVHDKLQKSCVTSVATCAQGAE